MDAPFLVVGGSRRYSFSRVFQRILPEEPLMRQVLITRSGPPDVLRVVDVLVVGYDDDCLLRHAGISHQKVSGFPSTLLGTDD